MRDKIIRGVSIDRGYGLDMVHRILFLCRLMIRIILLVYAIKIDGATSIAFSCGGISILLVRCLSLV